jgi:hypothetical protein
VEEERERERARKRKERKKEGRICMEGEWRGTVADEWDGR